MGRGGQGLVGVDRVRMPHGLEHGQIGNTVAVRMRLRQIDMVLVGELPDSPGLLLVADRRAVELTREPPVRLHQGRGDDMGYTQPARERIDDKRDRAGHEHNLSPGPAMFIHARSCLLEEARPNDITVTVAGQCLDLSYR